MVLEFFLIIQFTGKRFAISVKKENLQSLELQLHRSSKINNNSEIATYQCPVCGKIFDKEQASVRHINQMKKQEDNHASFLVFS